MPDPHWELLEKSATDNEKIEAAIARISQLYSSMLAFGTWGMVPKSQTDDEKIEEAIDRLVAVHEADPDSHLDIGESLQSHKAAAIIDHRIGSVVADKFSFTEGIYSTTFESLDNWTKSGQVYLNGWPGVGWYTDHSSISAELSTYLTPTYSYWLDYAKNSLIQFVFGIFAEVGYSLLMMVGHFTSVLCIDGYGFKIVDNVLRGFWGVGYDIDYTDEIDIDWGADHVYRAQYVAAEKKVYFYIDGVEVAVLYRPTISGTVDSYIYFFQDNNGASEQYCKLWNLCISRLQ